MSSKQPYRQENNNAHTVVGVNPGERVPTKSRMEGAAVPADAAFAVRLTGLWRARAQQSREESMRIRGTIKEATDAEERCLVRAEVWEKCAEELLDGIHPGLHRGDPANLSDYTPNPFQENVMSVAQKITFTYFRADGHYHCVGDAHENCRGTPAEIYQRVGDHIRSGRIGYPYVLVEVMGQKPFICTAETRTNEAKPIVDGEDARTAAPRTLTQIIEEADTVVKASCVGRVGMLGELIGDLARYQREHWKH